MFRGIAVCVGAAGGIEADERGGPNFGEEFVKSRQGKIQRIGRFLVGRNATVPLFERLHGALHLTGLAMDGARGPVHAAQLVQYRTANPHARVRFEGRSDAGIVLADGIQQSHHSSAVQVVAVHMRRKGHHDAADDSLDERQIFFDQFLLAGIPGACGGITRPQFGRRGSALHRDGRWRLGRNGGLTHFQVLAGLRGAGGRECRSR